MKTKKWLTIITFVCSILAVIGAIVAKLLSAGFLYDIAMAVFGSALLGFIMSLIEYSVERRLAMEAFWDESCKALKALREYRYINTDAPTELILECFREERSNEIGCLVDCQGEIVITAKNELISWFEEKKPINCDEVEDINEYWESVYTAQMKLYREEFQKCIESCITVAGVDLNKMKNAYGRLDFFFANQTVRKDAYLNIYKKLEEYRGYAFDELIHFKALREGKGNFSVCAKKAYAICQKIFEERIERQDFFENKVVYQSKFDDIDKRLEEFRCRIYRHSIPKELIQVPVCGMITNQVSFTQLEENTNKSEN